MKDKKKQEFNYENFEEEAIKGLLSGKGLSGESGVLMPMIKRIVEGALSGELNHHLDEEKQKGKANRRNGKLRKKLQTEYGETEIEQSRDREGNFEPELVPKWSHKLGMGLDDKILSMYAKGMSLSDIRSHLKDLYGLQLSEGKLSAITDQVLPELKAWRSRPLDEVYAFVWMDCIHYKVRANGRIERRAVYLILGTDREGYRDLLGMYASEHEGAKFWLSVLTDLQNRGVKDILIACIDNLKGFVQAIESIFPKTEVQLCVVHQIRNSLKYVTSEDKKQVAADLKTVYRASGLEAAEAALDAFEEKWGERYAVVVLSWRKNWIALSEYFKYTEPIRKVIYTNNIIEGFNRQLRKITKTKAVFPNELALFKLLYLAYKDISKKWTTKQRNWSLVVSQLALHFDGRLKLDLDY